MNNSFFDDLNSFIDEIIATSKKKEGQEVDMDLFNKQNVLNEKLRQNNYVLESHRDLNIITYVTTLELIREVITMMADRTIYKVLPNDYYELILKEIEPALDDLTLESLMLVVEQYNSISEISKGKGNSEFQREKEKEISLRHKEFQKVINKHQR